MHTTLYSFQGTESVVLSRLALVSSLAHVLLWLVEIDCSVTNIPEVYSSSVITAKNYQIISWAVGQFEVSNRALAL